MRRRSKFRFVLGVMLAAVTASSCSALHAYSRLPGIRYVSGLGRPPADTLIWSPIDASEVLVNSKGVGYGQARVEVLDIDTGRKVILAETENGNVWARSWSPDGQVVALSIAGATQGYPQAGLWLLDTRNHVMDFVSSKVGNVVWMPNGHSLGLVSVELASGQRPRQVSFSVISLGDRTEHQVYANAAAVTNLGVSLAPDGLSAVLSLTTRETELSNLYVLDLQTGVATQITQNGSSTFPAWSPDGSLIAYNKDYPAHGMPKSTLHLIRPDGSCDLELPNLDYAASPSWSPDGRRLVFIGPDGIYTVDLVTFLGTNAGRGACGVE